MANRDALKGMKDRLGAVDEEITDERAELVRKHAIPRCGPCS
jgi:hypothetical protein